MVDLSLLIIKDENIEIETTTSESEQDDIVEPMHLSEDQETSKLADKMEHFLDKIRQIFFENFIISKTDALDSKDLSTAIDRLLSKINFSSNDIMASFAILQKKVDVDIAKLKTILVNNFDGDRKISLLQLGLFTLAGFFIGFLASASIAMYSRSFRVIRRNSLSPRPSPRPSPVPNLAESESVNSLASHAIWDENYSLPKSLQPSLNLSSSPRYTSSGTPPSPIRPRLRKYFQSSSQCSIRSSPIQTATIRPILRAPSPLPSTIRPELHVPTPIRPALRVPITLEVVAPQSRPEPATRFQPFRFSAFSRYQPRSPPRLND